MTIDQLKERVELLLSLPKEHPSYLQYYQKYYDYLSENRFDIGDEYASKAMQMLPSALYKSREKDVVIRTVLDALRAQSRVDTLRRVPLTDFVFTKVVATKFLQEVNAQDFLDPFNRSLSFNPHLYRQKFATFLPVLKEAKDVFEYYSRFRRTLITALVNCVLLPEDVKPYRKIVETLESTVEAISNKLSLVDYDDTVELMDRFGGPVRTPLKTDITKNHLLNLMDYGISYIEKLGTIEKGGERGVYDALMLLVSAPPGAVLGDFAFGLATNAEVVYCRVRRDIVGEQKTAQGILTALSTELLLETAMHPATTMPSNIPLFDRPAILKRVENNLHLLLYNGVINAETQSRCCGQARRLILCEGG